MRLTTIDVRAVVYNSYMNIHYVTSAAAVVLLVAAFSGANPPPTHLHWIVSESSGHRLESAMPPGAYQAKLDNPNTFEIMNEPKRPDPLPNAKHVKFYRDEALLESELASGELAKYDGALLDDEAYREPGNTTPQVQMADPVIYFARASRALHAANKILVATIGFKVGAPGQFWSRTLAAVAPYPDVLDFQTQAAEGTPRFASMVQRLSRVFRSSGGHIMTVGLAISPKGESKTYEDLLQSYRAALELRPPVDGFWMNIATKSKSCTGCVSHPDVQPAAQLLMNTSE